MINLLLVKITKVSTTMLSTLKICNIEIDIQFGVTRYPETVSEVADVIS